MKPFRFLIGLMLLIGAVCALGIPISDTTWYHWQGALAAGEGAILGLAFVLIQNAFSYI